MPRHISAVFNDVRKLDGLSVIKRSSKTAFSVGLNQIKRYMKTRKFQRTETRLCQKRIFCHVLLPIFLNKVQRIQPVENLQFVDLEENWYIVWLNI